MTDPGRTLADMIAEEAPMPVRRAAAVLLAVTRQVQRGGQADSSPCRLGPSDITVHSDASVELSAGSGAPGELPGAGASIGRLFFQLLVGRPPLGRSDAFEPALTDVLPPELCALMAQAFSDAEGQWPSVDEWAAALADLAGGQATPPTAAELRWNKRRTALLTLGVVALAVATVAVLLLAPGWWDQVNDSTPGTTTSVPQP